MVSNLILVSKSVTSELEVLSCKKFVNEKSCTYFIFTE